MAAKLERIFGALTALAGIAGLIVSAPLLASGDRAWLLLLFLTGQTIILWGGAYLQSRRDYPIGLLLVTLSFLLLSAVTAMGVLSFSLFFVPATLLGLVTTIAAWTALFARWEEVMLPGVE
jgi:hypothetical protein